MEKKKVRNIPAIRALVSGLIVMASFTAGFITSELMQPTRQDVAEGLAQRVESEITGAKAIVENDYHAGPIVYVSIGAENPAARIEIGYEGEILASFWNKKQEFYKYHFGRSVKESELFAELEKRNNLGQ